MDIDVFCIQETHLTSKFYYLPGYTAITKSRISKKGGGVLILIKNHFKYENITLETDLEIVGVKLINDSSHHVNLFSWYLPPNTKIDFSSLINQIPKDNNILVGDVNAFHKLWGNNRNDVRGKNIVEFLDNCNLVCIKNKNFTRINCNGTSSIIDTVFASSNLSSKMDTKVLSDSCGSDHSPLLINCFQHSILKINYKNRINYTKINWEHFNSNFKEVVNNRSIKDSENLNNRIEEFSLDFKRSLEMSSTKIINNKNNRKKFFSVPYWNNECSVAIRIRKKALRKMTKNKTFANIIYYKTAKANAKRIISISKITYWDKYCKDITFNTKLSTMWRTVRNINGNSSKHEINLLNGDNYLVSNIEAANLLAEKFAEVCSNDSIPSYIRNMRSNTVSTILNNIKTKQSDIDSTSNLNADFSSLELDSAIYALNNNYSTGIDKIPNIAIKRLDDNNRNNLLLIINSLWKEGFVPTLWKQALVNPILKGIEDPTNPHSYRPISLTSSLCKVMEKIVGNRLENFCNNNNILRKNQCGFRKFHGPMDNLLALESTISSALNNKFYALAIFIDFSKAFDKLWADGIILKLRDIGVQGNMLNWIKNFLCNRTMQVVVGEDYSNIKHLENGIPQGGCLSPLLFNIMMYDFPTKSKRTLDLIFADDCCVAGIGNDLNILIYRMQEELNLINNWCLKWGFVINVEKTKAVIFHRFKNFNTKGTGYLKLGGYNIDFVNVYKYLGIFFDQRLTWEKHLNYIIDRVEKRINLLKCLASLPWSNSQNLLLIYYKNAIRSLLDYGAPLFSNANNKLLRKLDGIQYKCLRICMGAMKGTALCSLQVECGEMPLGLRRLAIELKEGIKTTLWKKSCTNEVFEQFSNPVIANIIFTRYFLNFRDMMDYYKNSIGEQFSPIPNCGILSENYFLFDWSLLTYSCEKDISLVIKKFNELCQSTYEHYLHIYVDGSWVDGLGAASAVCIPQLGIKTGEKFSHFHNILFAELFAILLGLREVQKANVKKAVIFSDSKEALDNILSGNNKLVYLTVSKVYNLIQQLDIDKVVLCWIPSHKGIQGNVDVDILAKTLVKSMYTNQVEFKVAKRQENKRQAKDTPLQGDEGAGASFGGALNLNLLNTPNVLRDVQAGHAMIEHYVNYKWSQQWKNIKVGRKHFEIRESLEKKWSCFETNRKMEILWNKIRMAKVITKDTLFNLKKCDNNICNYCKVCPETFEHFLMQCSSFDSTAQKIKREANNLNIKDLNLRQICDNKIMMTIVARELIKRERLFRYHTLLT